MIGIKQLDKEVNAILLNSELPQYNGFRYLRFRMKKGTLSLDKKIEIIEKYGNKEVLLTLHIKSDAKRNISVNPEGAE